MRFFIAVDIPEELKKEISGFINKLDLPGIRKVDHENLHVTLKFLGEFDRQRAISGLRGIDVGPFESGTTGIGYFPSKNYARVIWLGLEDNGFSRLVGEIEKRLSLPESRDVFVPHITIARARKPLKNPGLEFNPGKTVKVEKIALYSSELTPKGPVYTKIEEF